MHVGDEVAMHPYLVNKMTTYSRGMIMMYCVYHVPSKIYCALYSMLVFLFMPSDSAFLCVSGKEGSSGDDCTQSEQGWCYVCDAGRLDQYTQ